MIATFVFALLQAVGYFSLPYAARLVDTGKYITLAENSTFTREFVTGSRAWGYSLVLQIFGVNSSNVDYLDPEEPLHNSPAANRVYVFQEVIHIISWAVLAFFTGRMYQSYFGMAAVWLVYAVGSSNPVVYWNRMIMSESLTISLMVVLMGLGLWVLENPRSLLRYLVILPLAFYWVNLRDTNIMLILGIAVIVFVAGVVYKNWRAAFLAILLFGIYFTANFTFEKSQRWIMPLANVVFQRILPDSRALAFWENQGMPVNQALLDLTGQWSCSNNCAFNNSNELRANWDWHVDNGRPVYMRYLITNLYHSISTPIFNVHLIFSDFLKPPPWPDYHPPVPEWLTLILYWNGSPWILLATMTMGFILVVRMKERPGLALFLGIFVLAYPHWFLVYHGDTMEIPRHALALNIQMTLCFWIFLLACLEWYFYQREIKNAVL